MLVPGRCNAVADAEYKAVDALAGASSICRCEVDSSIVS